MKPLNRNSIFTRPFVLCASLCAAGGLHAASDTWSATAASGAWQEPTNWTGGNVPGATTGTSNPDTATFTTSSTTAVVADAARNLQNITFGGGSTFTISGGPLVMTSGGTILSNGSAVDERITAPITIAGDAGTYRIETNTPGGNRELILSGGITGSATAGNTAVLTLAGSSGGSNAISTVGISDGAAGGNLAVRKEGPGLWVYNIGNTYSGGTTITDGTLRLSNSGDTTNLIGPGTLTLEGTGTLRLQSTTSTNVNNDVVVNGTGGAISARTNDNFNPLTLTGTGVLTLTADAGLTFTSASFKGFAGTVKIQPAAGATMNLRFASGFDNTSLANAVLQLEAGANQTRQTGTNGTFTTDIGTLTGAAGSFLGGSTAGAGTFVFSIGGRNENSTFSGVIGDGGTKTAITKVGTGTLTLDGNNTYTGNTTVTGGTLSIANAYLANTSAVSIASGAQINLGFSGNDIISGLTLDGVVVEEGVYNSSHPDFGTYFTGPGSLQIGGVSAYMEWATGFGLQDPWLGVDPSLNGEPGADPDNDGDPNLTEFALGGSPVSGSDNAKVYHFTADSDADGDALPEMLMTIAVREDAPEFSAGPAPMAELDGLTYTVEGSTTLVSFDAPVTPASVPVETGLPAAPAGYAYRTFSLDNSNGLASKGFLRVRVTQ